MCGIVGYVGKKNACEIILDGLEKLEYRGYDSSGVAILNEDNLVVKKKVGRLSALSEGLLKNPIKGNIGMGHTRWATHGAPSDINSHPHTNTDGSIAVIHNGIIENYRAIKDELSLLGYKFKSETDTEVVAHLIDYYYKGDLLEAVFKTEKRIKGAYSLVVLAKDSPKEMVAIRHQSPMILGVSEDEWFVASDIPAILKYTKDMIYLQDKDTVKITAEGYTIYDEDKNIVQRPIDKILWDTESATKEGFEHFMLKEIHQQPTAIKDTLERRLDENGEIYLENISIDKNAIKEIDRIYIVGCGTAYHAGLVGKYILQTFLNTQVISDIASEFKYSEHIIDEKSLVIFVSQSGETLDTLTALKYAKEKGARVLSITNVVGSSIARESHDIFYTWAGPEIAVASTKAYTTQLTAFYMLALYFGKLKGTLEDSCYKEILEELRRIPVEVQRAIDEHKEIAEQVANDIKSHSSMFYLGRGLDNYSAMEGALKLKELSYIHTEAFAAGELKHGTIALIEKGTPVVAIAAQQNLYDKLVSNVKEVKARGAYVIGITRERNQDFKEVCDRVVFLPESFNIFMPLISVIFPQYLSYYTSLAKGNDVDKPRNLAKSVTVE